MSDEDFKVQQVDFRSRNGHDLGDLNVFANTNPRAILAKQSGDIYRKSHDIPQSHETLQRDDTSTLIFLGGISGLLFLTGFHHVLITAWGVGASILAGNKLSMCIERNKALRLENEKLREKKSLTHDDGAYKYRDVPYMLLTLSSIPLGGVLASYIGGINLSSILCGAISTSVIVPSALFTLRNNEKKNELRAMCRNAEVNKKKSTLRERYQTSKLGRYQWLLLKKAIKKTHKTSLLIVAVAVGAAGVYGAGKLIGRLADKDSAKKVTSSEKCVGLVMDTCYLARQVDRGPKVSFKNASNFFSDNIYLHDYIASQQSGGAKQVLLSKKERNFLLT